MAIELEGLEFKVEGLSGGSTKGLEELSNALSGLKSALPTKAKIQGVATGIAQLSTAFAQLSTHTKTMGRFAAAMGNLRQARVSSNLVKNLESLATSAAKFSDLSDEAITKIERLAAALRGLRGIRNIKLSVPRSATSEGTEVAENGVRTFKDRIRESTVEAQSFFSSLMSGSSMASQAFSVLASGIRKVGPALVAIPKFFAGRFVSGIGDAIKKVGELFAGLKRIAMYRLLRTAIKLFTQGLSEGLKNVYAYSQLVGTSFASNMDLIAINALYAKNSLGAMAAPLLNAIAPAVDYVTDKFVELFNVVNMFIARLTGAETATIAKKAATTWGDATEDAAGRGRQAVEELKRTILGFDELNVLQDNKDKGSGSGSGSGAGADVSSMFEQVPIESSISDFADRLKEAFQNGSWNEVGTIIGAKFNDIVNSVPWAEIGTNIGTGITAALQIVYGALTEADFQNLGSKFAELFNNALTAFDAETLGKLMVKRFSVLADLVIGAIMTVDWGLVSKRASEVIVGIFSELATWMQNVPWVDLTESLFVGLFNAIKGIEYGKLIGSMIELFTTALGSLAAVGVGILKTIWDGLVGAVKGIGTWIKNDIITPLINGVDLESRNNGEAFLQLGKNLIGLIFNGITSFFGGILTWIGTNIVTPFIEGFTKGFFGAEKGAELLELGSNIITGIFNGIINFFTGIGTWIKTNIFDKFVNGFKSIFGIHSPADNSTIVGLGTNLIEGIFNGIINWFANIGTWIRTNILDKFTAGWKTVFGEDGIISAGITATVEFVKKAGQTLAGLIGDATSATVEFAKKAGQTLAKLIGDTLSATVEFAKKTGQTLAKLIGDTTSAIVEFAKKSGQSLAKLIGDATEATVEFFKKTGQTLGGLIGTATEATVEFAKKAGQTLGGLIGDTMTATVEFAKKVGQTLMKLIGDSMTATVEFAKKAGQSLGDLIGTVTSAVVDFSKKAGQTLVTLIGNATTATVTFIKQMGQSLGGLIGTACSAIVSFAKEKGQSLGGLIGTATSAIVSFVKSTAKGQSLGGLIGTATSAVVSFIKSTAKGQTLGDLIGTACSAVVTFMKSTKRGQSLSGLIGSTMSAIVKFVKSSKKGQTLTGLIGSSMTATVNIVKGWVGSLQTWFNNTFGSGSTPEVRMKAVVSSSSYVGQASSGAREYTGKARGGAYFAGGWHNIPQYASGGIPTHGSMFVAGEAGAEVVGHINGRTEVLNASQLASAIHAAVLSAMQQANGSQSPMLNVTVRTEDNEVLARAVAKGQRSLDARLNPTAAY